LYFLSIINVSTNHILAIKYPVGAQFEPEYPAKYKFILNIFFTQKSNFSILREILTHFVVTDKS